MVMKAGKVFPVGKLPLDQMARLLSRCEVHDRRVLVGPRLGEDAAVISFGRDCLVVKTDPITFLSDEIGFYSVSVNANDIAAMGARPRWFLATVLLPEGKTDRKLVARTFRSLTGACRSAGVTLCGGHTEVTSGLDRTIVVGLMLGEVPRGGLVTSDGARVGDDLLLTKGIAIEDTSVLARTHGRKLARMVSGRLLQRARGFTRSPGLSVVEDAMVVVRAARVHAMHDPTEGGLATALAELARASSVGVLVEKEAVAVYPECAALCGALGLDPMGLIASGALLIAASPRDSGRVLAALRRRGIPACRIGAVTRRSAGLKMRAGGRIGKLPVFRRDEIARVARLTIADNLMG